MTRSPGFERLEVAVRLLGLGWYVAFSILVGVLAGVWLDGRTGLTPVFTLIGLGLGLVAAFVGAYRMAAPLLSSPTKRKG